MTAFDNLYRHGFVRAAVCGPRPVLADPEANAEAIVAMARDAHARGAALAVFPELSVTGYTLDDLFLQTALLDAAEDALAEIARATARLRPLVIVGAPLRLGPALHNCAVAIHRGRIIGVVPKTYLPNYREYYEKRHFAHGDHAAADEIAVAGEIVPFGVRTIFAADDIPDFAVGIEICEDMWAPHPPAVDAALAGATVLCNPSASPIVIAKAEERHVLSDSTSRRGVAAYLYAAAGGGESTTDLAWDGQLSAYEYGTLLGETPRFEEDARMLIVDIDVEKLAQERRRMGTFRDGAQRAGERMEGWLVVPFEVDPPTGSLPLEREIARFPFVPNAPERLDQDCYEAYNIQVSALATRLRATGIEKAVIGVSGGLDSTQALIVAAKAMDRLDRPRSNIVAVTMPGFATGAATKETALALMKGLGVDAREVDIKPLAQRMLTDLDHPAGEGEAVYDIAYENVQAGLRTDYLFRLANHVGGLVVGTGDLSELALGWCTYGVGDQMSHYNVNAGLPKTLIQHLIRWAIATDQFDKPVSDALERVLATEISPELVPAGEDGAIQSTESVIGPYALQDFNIHYALRWGFAPSKIAFLAHSAWGDAARGAWPANIAEGEKRAYGLSEIKRWLEVFVTRFYRTSQFKRSAMPNGPKLSTGGSLSPRGEWRAPSDATAAAWLADLADIPDAE